MPWSSTEELLPLPSLATAGVLAVATVLSWSLLRRKTWLLSDLLSASPLMVAVLGPLALPAVLWELCRSMLRQWKLGRYSVPPVQDALLLKSGVALARMIREGKLTSAELVDRYIRRIEQVNSVLGSVVYERFEEARQEALEADAAVASARVPAAARELWGVPCLIKECFEIPGGPYTAGILSRKGEKGREMSTAVLRLRQSGMPILGTTNVSEACMFHESNNVVYGLTRNPHDIGRTAGGSSGGCGSGVAAGMAPVAVASDVGGSTRIPAFYNGLFGHKPTGGTVPNTRTMPEIKPDCLISRYCQLGPLVRSAEDLMPLLRVLSGPDGVDLMTRQVALGNPEGVDFSRVKVLDFEEPFMSRAVRCSLHPDLRALQRKVADSLRDMGCDVKRADHKDLPEMGMAFSIWSAMMDRAQPVDFADLIYDKCNFPTPGVGGLAGHLIASIFGCGRSSRHTTPAVGLALLNKAVDLFPAAQEELCSRGMALKARLDRLLPPGTVLLFPSLLAPAPRHNENLLRFPSSSQTSIFNVMQLPCTAIPSGKTSSGLPLGVQVAAGEGQDHLPIAVALELERRGVCASPTVAQK